MTSPIETNKTETTKHEGLKPLITDLTDSITRAFSQEIFLALFVALFIYLRQYIIKNITRKNIITTYFKKESKVNEINLILENISKDLNADRVILARLHNGSSFLGSTSQVKLTTTNIFTKEHISRPTLLKDYPISLLYSEIDLLTHSTDFLWFNRNTCKHSCIKYLDKEEITELGLYLFFNKIHIPVAILGIHYCSSSCSLSKEERNTILEKYKSQLNSLLSNSRLH